MERTLADDVLVVFERACRENDLVVAEHLLAALETVAQRDEAQEILELAYFRLMKILSSRPTGKLSP